MAEFGHLQQVCGIMGFERVGLFVGAMGFLPLAQCLQYSAKVGMGLDIVGGEGEGVAMEFDGANRFALFKIKATQALVEFGVFNAGGEGLFEGLYGLRSFEDIGQVRVSYEIFWCEGDALPVGGSGLFLLPQLSVAGAQKQIEFGFGL